MAPFFALRYTKSIISKVDRKIAGFRRRNCDNIFKGSSIIDGTFTIDYQIFDGLNPSSAFNNE